MKRVLCMLSTRPDLAPAPSIATLGATADAPCAAPTAASALALASRTSIVTFGIRPVNRDRASAPIASTTGVPRSMPTSAVSSAEKIIGCVCSIRPSATFWPFTKSVPVPPLPSPPPS